MLVTTNLILSGWASVFGDAKMTVAFLDRFTHHSHIVATGDDSYRFNTSSTQHRKEQQTTKTTPT